MKKYKKLLDIIDVDWIKENPKTALELIEALVKESSHYKEVIQIQNEKLLISSAIIESMNNK